MVKKKKGETDWGGPRISSQAGKKKTPLNEGSGGRKGSGASKSSGDKKSSSKKK